MIKLTVNVVNAITKIQASLRGFKLNDFSHIIVYSE